MFGGTYTWTDLFSELYGKTKILLPNERVASVYYGIYYERDLSNSHAIVLLTWERTSLGKGGDTFGSFARHEMPRRKKRVFLCVSRSYSSAAGSTVITFSGFPGHLAIIEFNFRRI